MSVFGADELAMFTFVSLIVADGELHKGECIGE
jgi:hypothetical protein